MASRSRKSKTASRSEHSANYLTQESLGRAQRLSAIQKTRSQSSDMTGEQVEELLAKIIGGTWLPKRSNRAVPDLWDRDGVPYSVKTQGLKPVQCRPLWQDWLQHSELVIIGRYEPRGSLPKGKTRETASAGALGSRLIEAYNERIAQYGLEKLGVLFRLRVDAEQLWRYFYWTEDLTPLDPKLFKWSDASRGSRDGTRNLRAEYRDNPGSAAAITWASSGTVLSMRHEIPADADTWVVPDTQVLTREEGDAVIAAAIDRKNGI